MGGDTRQMYLDGWAPTQYLKQYYELASVPKDELANFEFATRMLSSRGRSIPRAIEVGCGPTLHHALVIAQFAQEVHLADYLPSNLAECRRSLNGEVGSHDWGVYAQGMFGESGSEKWQMLRQRVTHLFEFDVLTPPSVEYDLVASYYCIEVVAVDHASWRQCLHGLARLVAPGGALLLGTMRRCREYKVFGRSFPTVPVDESDFVSELSANGFDPRSITVEVVRVDDWVDQGFDSICCVWAEKPASPR